MCYYLINAFSVHVIEHLRYSYCFLLVYLTMLERVGISLDFSAHKFPLIFLYSNIFKQHVSLFCIVNFRELRK